MLQPGQRVVTVVSDQASRNWNQLHTTLSHMTSIKPAATYLPTGRASSILCRKELFASYLL